MKMVYLFNHYEVFENEHIGIRKKMQMQMQAFFDLGYEPIYIVCDEHKVLVKDFITNEINVFYFAGIIELYEFVMQKINEVVPEFVYMRYRIIYTPALYKFYKSLSKNVKKIICEFYTFPYDTEFDENDYDLMMDRLYSAGLRTIFKYSSNYNGYSDIMGIPSVSISNGISISKIPMAKFPDASSKAFQMICVSTMFPWHGYDRVIKGIYRYYQTGGKRKIIFHLVGKGAEFEKYKSLVSQYDLSESVVFHGAVTNLNELNRIFDGVHVAFGSVGMHRLNLNHVSPIKSAEYCARGIPFVINYEDISFAPNTEYIKIISSDDTEIDIEDIISFSEKNRTPVVSEKMRKYAAEKLSWFSQMKKVLDFCDIKY